jgi:hypothetical protein
VQSVNSRTGANSDFAAASGAKTTALTPPDRLYVFSPLQQGAFALVEA